MKFLIKQISTSKTELRITLDSVDLNGIKYYTFGTNKGSYDEGILDPKYIPPDRAKYSSSGPNPGIIRLVVAYLKDTLGTLDGFDSTLLHILGTETYIPIVNIAIDDINLLTLDSSTLPSMVVKLASPVSDDVKELTEVAIQRQIITSQDENVYYIPKKAPVLTYKGLDYDEGMKDEVGTSDLPKITYQNYNDLTASFNHTDNSIIGTILSSSYENLKVDYSEYDNHVFFGTAVSKIENFKLKVSNIETHLVKISQSLELTSSTAINDIRQDLFAKIQSEKNSFTPYEKELYYNGDKISSNYNISLGKNYVSSVPLNSAEQLLNIDGFNLINKASGSNTSSMMSLFDSKYNVEDKPFYNYSGSFYLSFLMKGDESINSDGNPSNLIWENAQGSNTPKLPQHSLYTSSILQPAVTSSKWQRYIFLASASYWAPHSDNPVIGYPGGISNFTGTDEIQLFSGSGVTGSYPITVGSRYSNLATTITSSGQPFTGSIVPAGELFRIYVNTNYNAEVTSSYLTDIKITKYDPSNSLPFADIIKTGSAEFLNWYDAEYISASLYDDQNQNSLIYTLPEYISYDTQMDNKQFRKFINLIGEYFDLFKVHIDNYNRLFNKGPAEKVPSNLLPILVKNLGWDFMLPFGKKEQADLVNFLGSSVNSTDTTADIKTNIWRNIYTNLNYIYKRKGTQNSIRGLLNSYGFPPDILRLQEHGASTVESDALTDDVSNLTDGLGGSTGNVSFQTKIDTMMMYVIDSGSREIETDWRTNDATSDAIEFVFKPVKNTILSQSILLSSGSAGETSWDVILETSASDSVKSRLQFRLNNTSNGASDINTVDNRISMSTDYQDFKNQNYWNVLLQRTTGPSGSDTYTSHSYEMFVGESKGDKLRVFSKVSMSFGGADYVHAGANFIGTGSRALGDSDNLIIGKEYTGSIAEVKTWKYPLSASIFKQHIYDKKSAVGNSLEDSQTNLIYHYRLNENWGSSSANPKIKDSNPNNIKDFSKTIPFSAFGTTPLYDSDEIERIQFNIRAGGGSEYSNNNILIDPDRRFIDNLNPFTPSILNLTDPLVNKRKASSVIEIVRSPQDVINDFILNQLGNFDFNDKFADPEDIIKPIYKDLEKLSINFFNHYNISLDVNKYIRAQVEIFNKEMIKSLKRLVPARTAFGKIGIEIKQTFLDRPKLKGVKIEAGSAGSSYGHGNSSAENSGFTSVTSGDIKTLHDYNFTDHDNDVYSGIKIFNLEPMNTDPGEGSLAIASHTGSVINLVQEYVQDTNIHLAVASHTGSTPNLTEEYVQDTNIHFAVASHTSSIPNLTEEYVKDTNIHFGVASHTGSSPNLTEEYVKDTNIHFAVASHTGSSPNLTEEYVKDTNIHFAVASHTASIPNLTEEFYQYQNIHFAISSHTGSTPSFNYEMHNNKIAGIAISSHTGSIPSLTEEYIPTKTGLITVASHTGSIVNLNYAWYGNQGNGYWYDVFDRTPALAIQPGSIITKDASTYSYEIRSPKLGYISIASHTGSLINLTNEYISTTDSHITIASNTSSIVTISENIITTHDGIIGVVSHTGSIVNYTYGLINDRNLEYDTTFGSKNIPKDGTVFFDLDKLNRYQGIIELSSATSSKPTITETVDIPPLTVVMVANATASNPTIRQYIIEPKEGTINYKGNDELIDRLNEDFKEISTDWGTTLDDLHFINTNIGSEGKDGYYNTYHYEKRYIFNLIGDVEHVSGSYSGSKSFETDFTGTVTANVFTGSIDIKNKTTVTNEIGLGTRNLGTTVEFRYSNEFYKGGKYLDETFIYPPNHTFLVGTTKNQISDLIYNGTQNVGGDKLDSEGFIDLFDDAIYEIWQTGAQGYYTEG